jgi:YggT family protein
VFSTLVSFNVLDTRNRFVWSVGEFLYRITEPVLRPIRSILPQFGAVDLSPLVAILLLEFIVGPLIGRVYEALMAGSWQRLVY